MKMKNMFVSLVIKILFEMILNGTSFSCKFKSSLGGWNAAQDACKFSNKKSCTRNL